MLIEQRSVCTTKYDHTLIHVLTFKRELHRRVRHVDHLNAARPHLHFSLPLRRSHHRQRTVLSEPWLCAMLSCFMSPPASVQITECHTPLPLTPPHLAAPLSPSINSKSFPLSRLASPSLLTLSNSVSPLSSQESQWLGACARARDGSFARWFGLFPVYERQSRSSHLRCDLLPERPCPASSSLLH